MAATTRSCASTYDVFLSFRGSDTRYGFTGNLYKALHDRGIYTFIDDEKLQRGEEITPALLKAIQESRIAITVLSKDYASSSFCLDELATIHDCAQNKGLLVIPVFYKVDPSYVRHQKGRYEEALAKHEKRFTAEKEKLQKWKMALQHVANLSGYHFKDGDAYEYKFIGSIVEHVSREINRAPLHVADYPVGLGSRVLEVRKLLDVGSDDVVHIIGIHGMGGLGKTTLALAVHNLIADHFDGSCFLQNVREQSKKHGLNHLQSILLSEILGEKDINLASVQRGISMIQQRLQRKKVLLILDDVDKQEQLKAIVGRPGWFCPGSRVIITTRDKQLLKSHEVERTYEVKVLNENDALQLLTWNAFKKEKADPSYEEVLHRVVTYVSGLPLALEVIGSNLFGKSVAEWESAIEHYKRVPHNDIQEILKVSFDALQYEEKSVFLDIACCFKGYALTELEDILHAHYGHSMKHHIGVLVEKSLIKIHWNHGVILHDLIEDMGKEIVRQESPNMPRERSRLWLSKDIIQVLKDNLGTCKIEIIYLYFIISDKEETVEWDANAFKEMKNLKTLIIKNGKFSKGPNYFPESLRVLEWHGYPSNCLPSNFHPNQLAICKLPDSCIMSFEFHGSSKKVGNLTVLNVDGCKFLTQIPDVSDLPNLKELSFRKCENLTTVHDSIGILANLQILKASHCSKLTSFPPLNLPSLEILELSYCSSLENFPEISGKMENIRDLELEGFSKIELPSSFLNLIGLKGLFLSCGIVQLPSSITMMPNLSAFSIYNCKRWPWVKSEEGEEKVGTIVSSKVDELSAVSCNLYDDFFSSGFTQFANVSCLYLSSNNFTFLPECIKEFHNLDWLEVNDCKHLQEIRGVPPKLMFFEALNCISLSSSGSSMLLNKELHQAVKPEFRFPGTSIPEWFDQQSRGPSISFWFRNKFPAKVLFILITPVKIDVIFSGHKPMVLINGKVRFNAHYNEKVEMLELDHTYLFDLQELDFHDDLFEVGLEKEWNHVEFTYEGVLESSLVKATGIHVFKEESSSMDDIRYDDPYSNTKVDGHLNTAESQNQSLPKSISFMWFAYVKEINLRNNNFKILPDCIKECQFLSYLDVSDCKHLQEIRGIPPNLQYFFAKNCKFLTSSSIGMFLNQDLHEAPKTQFCLPGARIPEWFDHHSSGPSSSFWFRNKFPDKVHSLVIAPVEDKNGFSNPIPMVFINGKVHESLFHSNKRRVRMEMDHTYLSDIQLMHFNDNLFEVALEKEWNHVEVTYAGVLETSLIKATGIHVFKQESSMDDILFVDPYSNQKVDDDINSSESQNQQLLKEHRCVDMEVSSTQFVQQQKCIVSCSSLLNPSCSYFHFFLLKQSSHCIIM